MLLTPLEARYGRTRPLQTSSTGTEPIDLDQQLEVNDAASWKDASI